uniref:THO complex subunit 5 homolog n=1 Tax=Phallusia mammillata TaxID=59560 RepID=A0A6F9DV89_9ASCI|nr:THO complex subunit 5 homolog [Phallusia mammillata]
MASSKPTMEQTVLMFSKVCENIRNNMSQVVTHKNADGQTKAENITELRMQGSFNFLTLKQLNRSAQIQCKSVKDKTLETKQKLDGYNLQLENLQYEISHLHKEITKCMEFRSRHEDIELVSENNFYKDAPADISRPDVTKHDEHIRTLARLDWELEQRKRLSNHLEEVKQIKDGVVEQTSVKKQKLQTLAPSLDNLLKSSLPLQDAFDLPIDKLRKQHELARLLPRPLFVLFLQAKAYQEACDKLMSVEIDGDESAARQLLQMQIETERRATASNNHNEDLKADESDSDQEEKDDQDSGRGHKSRRDSTRMEYENSVNSNSLFTCHPLQINIELKTKKSATALSLQFHYVTNHKFVTVRSSLHHRTKHSDASDSFLKASNLLTCLTPNDFGLQCPNATTNFSMDKVSASELSAAFQSVGHPYMWAQQVCGLEFLSAENSRQPGEDMQISFSHMKGTVEKLRKRVESRIKLTKQLEQFAKNVIRCDKDVTSMLPTQIYTSLSSWSQITFDEYSKLPQSAAVLDVGLLQGDGKSEQHAFYLATLKRGNTVTVKASVVVFASYPVDAPLIMLLLDWRGEKTSENDFNLREMEAELNIHWPKTLTHKMDSILSAQLLRLQSMVDVYVETECQNNEVGQPVEFPLNRICPLIAKGPARLKPFMYNSETKTHYHR